MRASSLTAIRAVIFSSTSCSTPCAAASARDRVIAVWKVATTGPRADSTASIDRLGASGSCTCSTSKSPAASHRRTRAVETGPNDIRATEPLYGTGTARPAGTTYGGSVGVLVGRGQHAHLVPEPDQRLGQVADVVLHAAGHVEGVRADDADPHGRPRLRPARRPGVTAGRAPGCVQPHSLQHVPVLRVAGDAGGHTVGDRAG